MNRTLLIALCIITAALATGCSPNAEVPSGSAATDAKIEQLRQTGEHIAAAPEPVINPSRSLIEAKPQPAPAPPMPAAPDLASQHRTLSTKQAKAEAKAGRIESSGFVGQERLEALRAPSEPTDREQYAHQEDNPVKRAAEQPLSTFSIDVDTGAYANVRRFLNQVGYPHKTLYGLKN